MVGRQGRRVAGAYSVRIDCAHFIFIFTESYAF